MYQNLKALQVRHLQSSVLELHSRSCRQFTKFAARLPRTFTTVTSESGMRKGNRRNDIVQNSLRSAVGCTSAALRVRENKQILSKEYGILRKAKEGLRELESRVLELKATVVLCRKEFFDLHVETEGMQDWDLEDEQAGKRVILQLVSSLADSSKCSSSLIAMRCWG